MYVRTYVCIHVCMYIFICAHFRYFEWSNSRVETVIPDRASGALKYLTAADDWFGLDELFGIRRFE